MSEQDKNKKSQGKKSSLFSRTRSFITPGRRRNAVINIRESDATASSSRPTPPPPHITASSIRPTPPPPHTTASSVRPTPPPLYQSGPYIYHQPTPFIYEPTSSVYRPTPLPSRHSISGSAPTPDNVIPSRHSVSGVHLSANIFGHDDTPFLDMMGNLTQHAQHHQLQQQQQQEEEELWVERRRRRRITNEIEILGKRAIVVPIGDALEPSKEAAKGIRIALQRVYNKPYPSYKKMLKEDPKIREQILEEFSTVCVWEPRHDKTVERNFHRLAAARLADLLYDARRGLLRSTERPNWIGENVWIQLIEHWRTDDNFKKRSEINKKNRQNNRGGNLHTQGSVSLATHARHLVKKLGRSIHVDELHKETHRKSTGEYVDERSRLTQERFDELLQEFLQEHTEYSSRAEIPEEIIMKIWDAASGPGATAHKRYGYGPLAPNFQHGSLLHVPDYAESSRPPGLTPEAQDVIEKLTDEMRERMEQFDRHAEQQRQWVEQQRQWQEQQRQWQAQVGSYFAVMNCPMPPLPPPPPVYGSSSSHAAGGTPQSDNEEDSDSD